MSIQASLDYTMPHSMIARMADHIEFSAALDSGIKKGRLDNAKIIQGCDIRQRLGDRVTAMLRSLPDAAFDKFDSAYRSALDLIAQRNAERLASVRYRRARQATQIAEVQLQELVGA